jgi:hypothetical protein
LNPAREDGRDEDEKPNGVEPPHERPGVVSRDRDVLRGRIENAIKLRKEAMLTAHPGGAHWRFARDVAAILEQMLRDHDQHGA